MFVSHPWVHIDWSPNKITFFFNSLGIIDCHFLPPLHSLEEKKHCSHPIGKAFKLGTLVSDRRHSKAWKTKTLLCKGSYFYQAYTNIYTNFIDIDTDTLALTDAGIDINKSKPNHLNIYWTNWNGPPKQKSFTDDLTFAPFKTFFFWHSCSLPTYLINIKKFFSPILSKYRKKIWWAYLSLFFEKKMWACVWYMNWYRNIYLEFLPYSEWWEYVE